jgi:excisionase family DNA binding protein
MAGTGDIRSGIVAAAGTAGRPITRADVLRAVEVARLLGIPKSTVEDWARRGVIPSRKRGKRRFFLRWEIESWLIAEDRAA